MDFLESQRNNKNEMDVNVANDFKYSAQAGELRIGDIFVKIYNQQPTFPIQASK